MQLQTNNKVLVSITGSATDLEQMNYRHGVSKNSREWPTNDWVTKVQIATQKERPVMTQS